MTRDKNLKEEPRKTAEIIFFPRHRIVRTILRGNRVYNPGKLYPEWDAERRDHALQGEPPACA
jgi:hypothetical protein